MKDPIYIWEVGLMRPKVPEPPKRLTSAVAKAAWEVAGKKTGNQVYVYVLEFRVNPEEMSEVEEKFDSLREIGSVEVIDLSLIGGEL